MDACPSHIFESTKGIEIETWFINIDRWQQEEAQCTRTTILLCIFTE